MEHNTSQGVGDRLGAAYKGELFEHTECISGY